MEEASLSVVGSFCGHGISSVLSLTALHTLNTVWLYGLFFTFMVSFAFF